MIITTYHHLLAVGGINEFIEKEGKWFNYIKGKAAKYSDARNAK